MSRDAVQMLQVFMQACDFRGVAPVRWKWVYVLLKRLGLLDKPCVKTKQMALLVCLILSAATTDEAWGQDLRVPIRKLLLLKRVFYLDGGTDSFGLLVVRTREG